ncbi:hypothetical protein ACFTSF_32450 [Kribbella sp. NPDC056951]|uniref:hypothetical protein n=1 Tax=Kribbella sp. NPDC056951 TaxID=3345978 RepID=UPI0036372AA4
MTLKFAWPQFREAWQLQLEVLRLDGSPSEATVDNERRRIRLDAVADWTEVELEATASTTERCPTTIGELAAHVLVSCSGTNLRLPVPLDQQDQTRFNGIIVIPRALVVGTIDIRLEVVGVSELSRLVGQSEPWTLVVDSSQVPPAPGVPPFRTIWINFNDSSAPAAAREAPTSHALMDLTTPEPILLLNSGVDGLHSLLSSKSPKLERRRHRDSIAAGIARYAASTLFRAAAGEVSATDDEAPAPPADRLGRQLCEAISAEMLRVSSVDELYDELARQTRMTAIDRAYLWTDIDSAIDRLTNHSKVIAGICTEVLHV